MQEKEPISKLCGEVGLQPTVFYRWQKEFFENWAAAFEAEGAAEPLGVPRADQSVLEFRLCSVELYSATVAA